MNSYYYYDPMSPTSASVIGSDNDDVSLQFQQPSLTTVMMMTLLQMCSMSTELCTSIILTPNTKPQLSPMPTPIHNSLMMVPMTTNADDADGSNPCMQHHPSSSFDNNICSPTPLNPQQWNEFCNDFLQFVNAFENANMQTNNDKTAFMTTTPDVDSDAWFPVAANTTHTPDMFPTKDNSPQESSLSVSSLTGFSPCYIDNSDAVADDDNQHSTLTSTTPHIYDDWISSYTLSLNEASNQLMPSVLLEQLRVPPCRSTKPALPKQYDTPLQKPCKQPPSRACCWVLLNRCQLSNHPHQSPTMGHVLH